VLPRCARIRARLGVPGASKSARQRSRLLELPEPFRRHAVYDHPLGDVFDEIALDGIHRTSSRTRSSVYWWHALRRPSRFTKG
jgi:hypothetical protein